MIRYFRIEVDKSAGAPKRRGGRLVFGFSPHEIPKLTKAKLLKPLGQPGVSATKLYSLSQLQLLKDDAPWLSKASDTMYKFWQNRNSV